jgi:hypothetical protein
VNDLLIVVPTRVTLEDLTAVLKRTWAVTGSATQPRVSLEPHATAYLSELELGPALEEEIFLDDPPMRDAVRARLGDYRLISLRYSDPRLAREMAIAIARSNLAEEPMLLNADGSFLTPDEFLRSDAE